MTFLHFKVNCFGAASKFFFSEDVMLLPFLFLALWIVEVVALNTISLICMFSKQ